MFNLRSTSLKTKLTLLTMFTSGVVLLMSVALFGFNDLRGLRRSTERDLQSLADVIGASAISSLDFDDGQAASKALEPLEHKPSIRSAAIYTKDDAVLGKYSRDGGGGPPPPRAAGGCFHKRHMLLF